MSIFAKCNTVRYIRKKAQEVLLLLIFTAFLRINSRHFSILKHLVYGIPESYDKPSFQYCYYFKSACLIPQLQLELLKIS